MKKKLALSLLYSLRVLAQDIQVDNQISNKEATFINQVEPVDKINENKLAQSILNEPGVEIIDKALAIVYGTEGTKVITKSDVERMGIDGKKRTLEDLIVDELNFMEAEKFKVVPKKEETEKFLKNIQKENKLSLDDIKKMFKAYGYTYDEGLSWFEKMNAIRTLLDYKITSRLVVTDDAITEYYNEHPKKIEAVYIIQKALVPFSDKKDPKLIKKEVDNFIATGKGLNDLKWGTDVELKASEISEQKKFVLEMMENQVAFSQETANGFELVRLKKKIEETSVPLKDRKIEIANILRMEKYESMLTEHNKKLLEESSVVYL
ncbi:MAG: SurA domain-containing protein [candidate division TM6 bacterium GW2011_GWF2_32_72]|nr:MAG: SurA domain-containing protein [candidate division TM6 bacterium GW2011_GWF2_32_72]